MALLYESPRGNLVDGLPLALHAEAVACCQGIFGPATIDEFDPWKLKIEEIRDITLPERFVKVLNCIVKIC